MTYWFYRFLAALPLPALYGLASLAAWFLRRVIGYRRNVVAANIERAFPDLDATGREQMLIDFYRHFVDTTLEIIAGYAMPMAALRERMVINNPEILDEASNGYRQSVIVMTLHQGNWEWMLYAANDRYPIDSAAVYKRLHDTGADRFSRESRSRFGTEPIEMREAGRNVIKHRRRPRLIFMVADQSPGRRERVHWTEFLNQRTAFFSGAAALARATGFPVVFAAGQRHSRGYYRIQLTLITNNPKTMEESAIIERYARLAEQAIKQSPAEWLWSNRRWKHSSQQVADADTGKSSDK